MSAAPRVKDIALEAASIAAREMRNLHDAIEVPWGEVHRLRKGDYEKAIPGGLAGEPIMVTAGYGGAHRKLLAGYGYAYAMAVQFGEVPESVSISPAGVSDDPASEHFADQLELFAERRFKVNYFLDREVQRYAESAFGRRVTLRPVGMQGVFEIHTPGPVSVRLETAAESPTPLPDGMVPYTVFVTPKLEGPSTSVSVDAAIYIPPSVLEEGGLEQPAVYVLDPAHGWVAPPNQSINVETRIFRARFEGVPTCSVLGPAILRAQPSTLAEEPALDEDVLQEPEPLHIAEETPSESERTEIPLSEPAEPLVEISPKASETGVEIPVPETSTPAPPALATISEVSIPEGAVRSGLAWGKNFEIALPADAGTVRVEAGESVGVYATVFETAPAPLPDGLNLVTPFVELHCSDPTVPASFELALKVPSAMTDRAEGLELYVYREDSGWQRLPDQRFEEQAGNIAGSDTRPGIYAVLTAGDAVQAETPAPEVDKDASAIAEFEESSTAEPAPVSAEKLPEVRTDAPEPREAPRSARHQKSIFAWGQSVELATKGAHAEFTVDADASIGAFTKVLTEPPAPFPEGLRAYGSIVALSLSEQDAHVRIGMTLSPEKPLPNSLDMSSLAIYAFEPDTGWTRLENQKFDAATETFAASDTYPSIYVILGPGE
ncbi:MAG: penicillin acylase family protein, partial [Candidatus Hydrogenedentes bacterium]|nr:penicillin acylase family protein [Candidatus Hydrogenedentota bacterium]